jgi:hypothetical protein
MSEYQYYEFLAVDRPLTAAQQAAVRNISTRAEISATSFVNEYQWGDFKGDVYDFLKRYYDAHLYLANWGTRRFAFRLPKDLVDRAAVEAYAHDNSLDVKAAGDWLLVDISPSSDGDNDYDDESGHGMMASLIGCRAEVLSGDLRPLFIGWLAGVQLDGPLGGGDDEGSDWTGASDDDAVPPVPAGMGKLSAAQQALADFFGVHDELLEVAAAGSPPPTPPADLAKLLAKTASSQRDQWLRDLVTGDDPLALARIRQQLLANTSAARPAESGRTVGELREAWGELDARRRREKAAVAAAAKRKRDAAAAAERERYLSDLAGRVAGAWKDVDLMIDQRNSKSYDQAALLLSDLKAVADRPGGDPSEFQNQLAKRLANNTRRPNFIAAVRKMGLV